MPATGTGVLEPAPATIEAEEAAPLRARIDSIFQAWDRPGSPGCALGVMRAGEIVYAHGYGMANLDHDIPITPATVFYIASVSKQFAAAAVALLAERDQLSLDDALRTHIPELPAYAEEITVRQLINHTSGIRDYLTLMPMAGRNTADVFSHRDVIELLARQQRLNFEPGSAHLYSNSGYVLLAEIVERVSGRSLRQFADEQIFQPLGMRNTHFHDDRREIVRGRATGYNSAGSGFSVAHLMNFAGVGDGGLYTTVEDIALWDRNFENTRLGGPGFMPLFLERGKLYDGRMLSYGFGLTHGTHRGLPTIGHGGSFMGFRADYVRFPEQRLAVAVFCNLGGINPSPLSRGVAALFLAAEMEAAEAAAAGRAAARPQPAQPAARETAPRPPARPADLEEYLGEYFSPELDVTYSFTVEGDRLSLRRPGGRVTASPTAEPDSFRAGSWTITFRRDAGGRVTGFELDAGRVRELSFVRRTPGA